MLHLLRLKVQQNIGLRESILRVIQEFSYTMSVRLAQMIKFGLLRPDDVIMIGRLFETGKLHAKRIVALTGDCLSDKAYMEVPSGCSNR